jgi:hypothetical protein
MTPNGYELFPIEANEMIPFYANVNDNNKWLTMFF